VRSPLLVFWIFILSTLHVFWKLRKVRSKLAHPNLVLMRARSVCPFCSASAAQETQTAKGWIFPTHFFTRSQW